MGNNKGTEAKTILVVENYFASGMGLIEYAEIVKINRSTIASMVKRYEAITGKPLPKKNENRDSTIAYKFYNDMIEGRLPEIEIPTIRKEEKKMNPAIQETTKTIIETRSEETKEIKESNPAIKKTAGRPALTYKETKYSFGMKEEDFDLLRAYCTIKQRNIKEVIQEAIFEYLEKPENEESIQEAKKLLKMIQKSK